MQKKALGVTTAVVAVMLAGPASAQDKVSTNAAPTGSVDYANARPMPMPKSAKLPVGLGKAVTRSVVRKGLAGATDGSSGDGVTSPVTLPVNKALAKAEAAAGAAAAAASGGVTPQQSGISSHPFTTARANAVGDYTARYFPFRAAGKLFFNIGGSSYVCSASLIKRGLIVTAAHCVTAYGTRTWYADWRFVPAYQNGLAPYGTWTTRRRHVLASYLAGTDNCTVAGIVCENDVAVLEITGNRGVYPGDHTGWYGYGYNGYGFTGSGVRAGNLGHITQLGYPVALDDGELMERTDSFAYTDGSLSDNNVIGSQQSGGSSGGPWLVNFGSAPAVTGYSGTAGSEAGPNRVVGVTSWGYVDPSIREQGASPFLSTNIVALVDKACANAASPRVCE